MIPTTTRAEQKFWRSSKNAGCSSRVMIQVLSGSDIAVARPDYHDADNAYLWWYNCCIVGNETWNNETEHKQLVEGWNISLGSGYSESEAKLGNTDQNPNEKRGHHQCCPCCPRYHAFLTRSAWSNFLDTVKPEHLSLFLSCFCFFLYLEEKASEKTGFVQSARPRGVLPIFPAW